MAARPRGLFLSWAKLRRADSIAERLGVPSLTVRYFYRGTPPLLTAWKYLLQGVHTFCLLLRRRPHVVLVTSPPIFALFPVYAYAVLARARYAIDFHSGSFLEAHWRRWDWLQKFFARRAALNLVHNDDNARVVDPWGVRYMVFPSLPPALDGARQSAARARPVVVYICSFKPDEPVEDFLDAARQTADADFLVTGRAPRGLEARLPPNVRLTGFLGEEEYNEVLRGADVIVALTTRPGTLLYGAQEAVALGKPLVLSRTPTLEGYFEGGAVFAENTAAGIRVGILEGLARKEEQASAMAEFRERCRQEGEARVAELKARLQL